MLGILRADCVPRAHWLSIPRFIYGGNCLKFSLTPQSKLFHGKYRGNSLYSLTADGKRFFSNLSKSEIKFMVKGSCIKKALYFCIFFKYESTNKKRFYVLSTWPKKWGAAAEEALSMSRWLSREEWREEKDWRDLQDSLLDLPPVVKGEPPGVVTDTEKDLSSSNFDLVSSVLDRNASSLPSILSTTSPRLWTWWENTEDIYYILKVSLNIIIRSFFAAYLYTWLNIANSWPIICFQPVAAVLRRLFSTFFVSRDQIVSTINCWHSIQVE